MLLPTSLHIDFTPFNLSLSQCSQTWQVISLCGDCDDDLLDVCCVTHPVAQVRRVQHTQDIYHISILYIYRSVSGFKVQSSPPDEMHMLILQLVQLLHTLLARSDIYFPPMN